MPREHAEAESHDTDTAWTGGGSPAGKRPRTANLPAGGDASNVEGSGGEHAARGAFDEDAMNGNFNAAMGFTGDGPTAAQTSAGNKAAIDKMKKARDRLFEFIEDGRFDADEHYLGVEKRLEAVTDAAMDIDWDDGMSRQGALRARKYFVKSVQEVRRVMRDEAAQKWVKKKYQSMITYARYTLVPFVKKARKVIDP